MEIAFTDWQFYYLLFSFSFLKAQISFCYHFLKFWSTLLNISWKERSGKWILWSFLHGKISKVTERNGYWIWIVYRQLSCQTSKNIPLTLVSVFWKCLKPFICFLQTENQLWGLLYLLYSTIWLWCASFDFLGLKLFAPILIL